ncbi:ATP-binding protein [Variovorax sp. ZT4R33]|uniref:ATP-binding protein n=1 Tax=Variovorax sp. ZT4R33 TaxID=3443743 RepID=UPI003F449F74
MSLPNDANDAPGAATVVWYTSEDGAVTQPNPQWQAFTGQSRRNYEGWGWLDAIHPDDRGRVRQRWAEAAASGEPIRLNYRLRRHDGAYRDVVAQGAPIFDHGRLSQWVGFVVDATESLRAEKALKASEERFRVLDAISQATRHLRDSDSIMAATARLLGQALGATRCAYADVDSDSDRFTIRSDWAMDGVPSSAGVYSLNLFGPQATSNLRVGRHLVVNDVDRELGEEGGARMFNAIGVKAIICAGLVKDGRLVAMMAVHQAEPRHWTADEVHTVSEVVDRCWAHIERVRDAAMLREQDTRKDEFIATLAHELRNPLAPIKYAVAIASRHEVPVEVGRKHAVIDRQVSLMARLIDDLLDVSRINRGLIQLRREQAQLDVLVAQALETTQSLIDVRQHRLEVRVPPHIGVNVDPARLVQVIGNLLANAAKYTPLAGRIEVEGRVQGDHAVLSVSDSGLGIPPGDLARVFQTFAQLDHTKAHAQGGLGLGLALVEKLVALHGGRVYVRSPGLDQGSTFTLELPLSVDAEGSATAGPAGGVDDALPAIPPGTRVLVVEDNDDGRETLVELLQGMGHRVQGVSNGEDALAAAADTLPQLVLLDLGLPGLDGYEVARRLRQQRGADRMALIALTGWGATRDVARSQAAGFDHHLTKPVEAAMLERTIRLALRRVV